MLREPGRLDGAGRAARRLAGGRYGAGVGSRSSLPTRPGPSERSAAIASGSLRAKFASSPNTSMLVTTDDPPEEINGSGNPVTGSSPTT